MDIVPAEGLLASSWLLIALPLLGAAVLLLGGRRTDPGGHLLARATLGTPVVLGGASSVALYPFTSPGGLDVRAGLLYDPLSAIFVLLITGVGSLIHIYSVGYMGHDPARPRVFAYLNLSAP